MESRVLATLLAAAAIGCTEEPEPRICELMGATVNIGQTTGGPDCADLGSTHLLCFDNTSLNFQTYLAGDQLVDTGAAECLEDIPLLTDPGLAEVAWVLGHGYIVTFEDGTRARFRAGSYSDGTVTVTFDYPFEP